MISFWLAGATGWNTGSQPLRLHSSKSSSHCGSRHVNIPAKSGRSCSSATSVYMRRRHQRSLRCRPAYRSPSCAIVHACDIGNRSVSRDITSSMNAAAASSPSVSAIIRHACCVRSTASVKRDVAAYAAANRPSVRGYDGSSRGVRSSAICSKRARASKAAARSARDAAASAYGMPASAPGTVLLRA